jgi:23S rRNA (uridine2552-2'-O)-methyltransferase
MARSKSSGRWLNEHFHDEYVRQARALGFRSRAVFKLKEMNERDGFLRTGMRVLDLGAAPGAWSQYATQAVGRRGAVVALDILPMEPIPGVKAIAGDLCDEAVFRELTDLLGEKKMDVVLSDMAPNMSGTRAVDQPRALYLADLGFDAAQTVLADGGVFLVKLFHGSGFEAFQRQARESFEKVVIRKPKASRDRSREIYLLAKGFKPG